MKVCVFMNKFQANVTVLESSCIQLKFDIFSHN